MRSNVGSETGMAADFIIAPEVELDISEAYGWYEGHRSGLGEEFLSCVDACIHRIRRSDPSGKRGEPRTMNEHPLLAPRPRQSGNELPQSKTRRDVRSLSLPARLARTVQIAQ